MAAPFAHLVRFALLTGAIACDAGTLLGGARHFAEIDADDAAQRIAAEPCFLVQVRAPDSGDPRVAGAEILLPDQALPERSRADGKPTFVIGREDRDARRFAARLVRAGFERVAAVRGGIQPWLAHPSDRDRPR